MAQDRGGLNYRIAIRDEFSEATGRFVSSIRQAKEEFAAFRAEVAKGSTAAQQLRNASREAVQNSRARSQAARNASRDEAAAARVRLFLIKQEEAAERRLQRAGREAARLRRADEQAQQRAIRGTVQAQLARERESRRILASLRRDEAAFQREQLRRIQQLASARAEAERQRVALARAARAEQAARDRASPDRQGAQRAAALIQQRAVAQAEIAELRRLGREELITRNLRRQAGELNASARTANSLLFTFRRLVGVLAAFQIARAVVGGFRDLIVEGVRFNDTIRQAEISIAGLITGLADVRNEQGQSVELAEEYSRALTEARRQTELLRQDALLTTATFEQLLDTFQISIGPGFAAGLNLDEIRRLSVSISQAATAIGLPQNQLAEEIRSLLSGTIQARTTRIATALQITNADIRRLRASGELFDFLEDRFRALGLAAEQAARQTLSGIGNLVRDATSAILGRAAAPLFEELISLGNEVFDQVLTIRDATGDIRPNPQAVAAFQAFFDALRDGVEAARELGREVGFEGLRNIVATIGTGLNVALQAAIGFVTSFARAFNAVLTPIRAVTGALGGVGASVGDISRFVGGLVADFLILRGVTRFLGVDILRTFSARNLGRFVALLRDNAGLLGRGGLFGAAVIAVGKGFELWLEHLLGVNLTLVDTVRLLSVGVRTQLDDIITKGLVGLTTVAENLKKLFTSDEDARAEIKRRAKLFRDALREDNAAQNAELEALLLEIQTKGLPKPAGGEGAAAGAAAEAADNFGAIISNVESIVASANGELSALDEALKDVSAEFRASAGISGAEGFAGQVEQAMAEARASVETASTSIRGSLAEIRRGIEEAIAASSIQPERVNTLQNIANRPAGRGTDAIIAALNLNEEQGRLLSLLRDEARIRATLQELENASLNNAKLKIAIQARARTQELGRELADLREQAAAEGAIAIAVRQRLGARRLAAIESENELQAFLVGSQRRLDALRAERDAAREQALPITGVADTELERERQAAAAALAVELEKTLALEEAIAAAKEEQLRFAAEQARLAAEGTFTAGVRAGFEQLANDLPTLFDAARNIVTGITQSFVSAAGQLFRDLFDPRVQADAGVALGEFLLNAGQLIFEQTLSTLLQSLISSALSASTIETTAATTAASIKVSAASSAAAIEVNAATLAASIRAGSGAVGGAAQGGLVPVGGFALGGRVPRVPRGPIPSTHARARGLARGGRPRGLDPRDTVPAFLQPGEFVVRKAVVDDLGVGFFSAVNAGRFSAPPSAPPPGPGFQGGGQVIRRTPAQQSGSGASGSVQIVPAVVTSEREMDRLQAGGKNAQLRFMRENAGTIRGILGI